MSATQQYLLGDSPVEVRHLVEQAELYAQEATELFDAIGLRAGWSAIDVGCGAMGVLHLLAARLGADGRVVGLDREPRFLEVGRRLAAERGLAVDFIEGNAAATGLPDGAFDLVHARTVLVNVTNPAEILAEMVRIARPGGIVALQEPDAGGWICDPPHPAWDSLCTWLSNAYEQTGRDWNIGRRIARMLRDAGLADVQVRVTVRLTHRGDFYHTFLLMMAGLVREVILDAGRLTADELDSHVSALRTHLDAPETLTRQPLMWQAWGHKPQRPSSSSRAVTEGD
jgi:SAM-dependent methyltransferase